MAQNSDGKVTIFCDDNRTVQVIEKEAKIKLIENYEVVVLKEIKPKILIIGMSESYNKNDR